MPTLKALKNRDDIPEIYRDTPIGDLVEYHNFNRPFDDYSNAALLVGMCMDHRKSLHIPKNFAYIIRDGAARMTGKEFRISFAITVGGVRHIAVIGHSHCGMVSLDSNKDKFIRGLVDNLQWDLDRAEGHYASGASSSGIDNAIDFTAGQARHLRIFYPGIVVAPLYYKLDDNRLYLIIE